MFQSELILSGNTDSSEPEDYPAVVKKLKPTIAYRSYWRFATLRQEVFFARLEARDSFSVFPNPDPILARYKFTNAYRASDRTSQYLIRNVIYKGCQEVDEVFFRVMLFKLFNKIETWELLLKELGVIEYASFSPLIYGRVLDRAMASGLRIYSAAYIMPSGGRGSFQRKHDMHLNLLQRMMCDQLPQKIAELPTMRHAFQTLRSYPSIGDFLAYQFATDLNYGPHTNFPEMQFTCAGPGAIDGISKCFQNAKAYSSQEIIAMMAEIQQSEFSRYGYNFKNLWGRELQLIDCQNLFCEISKYSRVAHPEISGIAGRTRIKQSFRPTKELPAPWYPPKWNLNEKIASISCYVR